ncbi:MAG: DUF4175 family protein [Bacteroidales bacterium]
MSNEINILIEKLDTFIKKYYRNKFLKGIILFLLISIFYFSAIFIIEYIAYLPTGIRRIIFYFSILLSALTAVYYIIIPFFQILKIGKTINYEQASEIITHHFPEIKDTLINTLQLSQHNDLQDNSLIVAAINQKIASLKPIPFSDAVQLTTLKKYFIYSVSTIIVAILLYFLFPHIFSGSAERIIEYNTTFEKPAPFRFILDNKTTSAVKGEDYTIKLSIKGEYVPQRVFLLLGNTRFIMKKIHSHEFEYTHKNCTNDFSFRFQADEYTSKQYTITIKPKPQLLRFSITAEPPKYTNEDNFTIENTGDITVPTGTKLAWNIQSIDTDSLYLFNKQDSTLQTFQKNNDTFTNSFTIYNTSTYNLQGANSFFSSHSIIDYTITTIPDTKPTLSIRSKKDSTHFFTHYFSGRIQDDYGFTNLTFTWFKTSLPDSTHTIPLQFSKHIPIQEFNYRHQFESIDEKDSIKYYFEVTDNDKVNGPKTTRTPIAVFTIPTYEEQQEKMKSLQSETEKSLKESISTNKEIMKDIQDIQKKLLQKNISDWERSQLMNELQEKKQNLEKSIAQTQESFKQKNELNKQLNKQKEDIVKKNEEIQKLLENLMDNDLKEMFEEMNSIMEEFNRDEFFKESEELNMSLEELSKQLDRDLELLKQAEIEEQVNKTSEQLKKLSEKQEKIAQETKNKENSQSELRKKEEQISEDVQKLEKEYKDIQEKNKKLNEKISLPSYKEDFQKIKDDINKSLEELNNNNRKKSSDNMQKSSEDLEKLAENMQDMMDQQTKEQHVEDMNNLEQIIDNMLTFSHKQENLISETKTLSFRDPKYAEIASKQNTLRENFNSIKDSIYNLSMRIPQISTPVNKEMFAIYKNMNYALNHLEQRQRSGAMVNQRYIMTSANNVILLLSEILESMQQAQQQKGGGKQCPNQCNNPSSSGEGKRKPSMQNLQQMQESLKQQMQQMMEQMKNGKNMAPGNQAKQLSKMLSEQEMMKQMMNELMKNGNISPEGTEQLKDIQQIMENVERDIINQNITNQTLHRQEEILTRLLESQKAENERDKDETREGTEAENNTSDINDSAFPNTDNTQENEYIDLLEQTNLKLKTYYKKIYSHYLLQINQN